MEPFQVGIIALIAVLVLLANRVDSGRAGIVASLSIFMIFAWPGQDFRRSMRFSRPCR